MQNESGIIPTGDKIVVKPLEVEETTKGGIVLAKTIQQKEQRAARIGKVIAISPHVRASPHLNGIAVGDDVLYARYSGDEWPVNGTLYLVMRDISVIGKAECQPDYMLNAALGSFDAIAQQNAA